MPPATSTSGVIAWILSSPSAWFKSTQPENQIQGHKISMVSNPADDNPVILSFPKDDFIMSGQYMTELSPSSWDDSHSEVSSPSGDGISDERLEEVSILAEAELEKHRKEPGVSPEVVDMRIQLMERLAGQWREGASNGH
ncbi:hypothetical protein FRB94_011906 [Tulasnella sp. JGI-2019a]|nr:hypothetical protein FRB94_011906 [Tulasnella sp. JGI-2019a]